MNITFGPPEMASEGEISIRRSPNKVIYIRWGDKWPAEPPSGENWLIPRDNDIRFMYHPTLGLVLFYALVPGEGRKSHAAMVSKPKDQFGLPLPHFDTWVRADAKRGRGGHIKTDELRLGPKSTDLKIKFWNFRAMLTHLRTLGAVPCDYPVRMNLLKRGKLQGGVVTQTSVRDWCKCCEDQ